MIVMIDNYDSFTYNLVQYLKILGTRVRVFRNDAVSIQELVALNPAGFVISPGPGRPESAGICIELIRRFTGQKPILGVCLGHQAIAVAFGGSIVSARRLMHGKTSSITSNGTGLFSGVTNPFAAMRYHSLAVCADDLPPCLQVSAESEDNEIMGIQHLHHPTEGIQFHPESIMTPVGKRLLRNFLKLTVAKHSTGIEATPCRMTA